MGGVELIAKDEGLYNDTGNVGIIVREYFSSVSVIMLTLVQFVTLDSIGSIYTPLIHRSPFLLGGYFILFLIVVSISLMNLVTAVIVEGAIEQGKNDKEVQKAYEQTKIVKLVPTIRCLFLELDADGSGTVSLDEILDAPDNVKEELTHIMQTDQLAVLFELLDTDGSGEISIDEFCDGITKMINSDEPMEFIRLRKQMAQQRSEMVRITDRLGSLEAKVDQRMKDIDSNLAVVTRHILGQAALNA